jgi:hypothetical protein
MQPANAYRIRHRIAAAAPQSHIKRVIVKTQACRAPNQAA